MRGFAGLLVALLAPFVLRFGSAGLIGLGLHREVPFLVWTGLVAFAGGALWCLFLYLWADSGISFWDRGSPPGAGTGEGWCIPAMPSPFQEPPVWGGSASQGS